MFIRNATIGDYEEIVEMYYELMKVCFPHRKLGAKIFFYEKIRNWFYNKNNELRVVQKDDEIIGFSMCYVDNIEMITEDVLNADMVYIKPKYRKTRAAYLIWDTLVNRAKELGIGMTTLATPEASKVTLKRYNTKIAFIMIEAAKEDIKQYKE